MSDDEYKPSTGKPSKEPPKALPGGHRPLGLPSYETRANPTSALRAQIVAKTRALDASDAAPPPAKTDAVAPSGSLLAPAEAGTKDEWKEHLRASVMSLMAFLGPRIDFLLRAALTAGLPLPGVDAAILDTPCSPTGEKFVSYLVPVLQRDPQLAQSVTIAITYFRTVTEQVEQFERGPRWKRPDIGRFRAMLLYLGNLPGHFKRDAILCSLFPMAPAEVKLDKPKVTPKFVAPERRAALEAILKKAKALQTELHPKMSTVKMALDDLEKPVFKTLGGMIAPGAARLKLVVLAMRGRPELEQRARESLELYQKFLLVLRKSETAIEEAEALKDLAIPLGRLAQDYQDEPQLAALFA